MTREEAIKFLKLMRKAVSNFEEYGHDKASMVIECDKAEAIDMAIEALQEPKWNCTASFVAEQLEKLKGMTEEEKWDFFSRFFGTTEQTEYKLPGHDEVMEALDNMRLDFTVHGKERIKRIKVEK